MKEQTNTIERFHLKQAAKRLGFSALTLRRLAKSGEISYYRPTDNGHFLFTEEHLSEFEKRRTFEAVTTSK